MVPMYVYWTVNKRRAIFGGGSLALSSVVPRRDRKAAGS